MYKWVQQANRGSMILSAAFKHRPVFFSLQLNVKMLSGRQARPSCANMSCLAEASMCANHVAPLAKVWAHTHTFNEANPVLITSLIAGNQRSSQGTINHTHTAKPHTQMSHRLVFTLTRFHTYAPHSENKMLQTLDSSELFTYNTKYSSTLSLLYHDQH